MALIRSGPLSQTLQVSSHLPMLNLKSIATQTQEKKTKRNETPELTEATPWRDRAKASSTERAPDLLRSDSLRMDKIAPAASSALESKESPSSSTPGLFPLNSSALDEGGAALYAWGLQTVMGMTSNGGLTALPEESLAFAAETERGCELRALETSGEGGITCPRTRTWAEGEEEDDPNFGTLPQDGPLFTGESRVFCFTLRDFRDSVSTSAKSSPFVGLVAGGPS